MTDDNLIDAAALGIANVFRDDHGLRRASHVDEFDDPEHFRKLARAALSVVAEAMREPTEEMDRAGSSEDLHYCPGSRFAHWSAMLAASPLNKGE